MAIEGASNAAAFREEVNGTRFTVTIASLPAGKYTITIGEVETLMSGPGERVFDVTSGDTVLAKDFDIFATAGAARKVCNITGTVEHEDDSIRGPLTILFVASKKTAKFNTIEVKNASGASVCRVQCFGIGGRLFGRRGSRAGSQRAADLARFVAPFESTCG